MQKKFTDENAGFTLLELLVVLAIVVILAFSVGGAFGSAEVQVRSQIFGMMSDFNRVRSEAVRDGREIQVVLMVRGEVDDDGRVQAADGYRSCRDEDDDGNCDAADSRVKEVRLADGVSFYAADLAAPVGPDRTISGEPWVSGGDGISFSANRFAMKADGTSDKGGTVYLYATGGKTGIRGGPLALVMNRIGRMRIARWRPDISEWQSK